MGALGAAASDLESWEDYVAKPQIDRAAQDTGFGDLAFPMAKQRNFAFSASMGCVHP
jgi:hypothetical protein